MRTSLRSSRHCSEARFAVMFSSGCPKHLPNRPSGKAVPKHLPIQSVSAKPCQPKCRRHFSSSRYILAAVDSCVPWRASSRRRRSGDSRSPKCCCTWAYAECQSHRLNDRQMSERLRVSLVSASRITSLVCMCLHDGERRLRVDQEPIRHLNPNPKSALSKSIWSQGLADFQAGFAYAAVLQIDAERGDEHRQHLQRPQLLQQPTRKRQAGIGSP